MPRIRWNVIAAAAACVLASLYEIGPTPVHAATPRGFYGLRPDLQPQRLPDVTFEDAWGRHHTLAEFRGRPVILNLWATWCGPCVRELPALGRLAQTMGPRIAIIAVNAGRDSGAETRAFLVTHGAGALAAYRDPHLALMTAFGTQGLPFSVVVDARGDEIARASGPLEWDHPASIAYFSRLAGR
jgi:thiol-disulfide isomerase/thioredoxin